MYEYLQSSLTLKTLALALVLPLASIVASKAASHASGDTGAPVATAPAPNPEEAGVRAALDAYMQGHATGQADAFRRAFHPDTRMLFMRDGKFNKVEIADYIARAPGKPADDEAKRKRSIDLIDIAGDAAIARLTLDYPDVKFTDYMTLLKVDGEWRIVSKVFAADRRPAAERKSS